MDTYSLSDESDGDLLNETAHDKIYFDKFQDFYSGISSRTDEEPGCDSDRYDFPRLNNFNIDSFDYYTPDKLNRTLDNNETYRSALKIIHINIRGLELHFDDLNLFLNTFNNPFSIITLSECHLRNNNTYLNNNRFHIAGYDKFFVFSEIGYGGCAIYSKK